MSTPKSPCVICKTDDLNNHKENCPLDRSQSIEKQTAEKCAQIALDEINEGGLVAAVQSRVCFDISRKIKEYFGVDV